MADPITLPSDADHTGREFGYDELALLREVLESGTLNCTRGTQVKAFEREFAERYGVPHARAVSSGTAACHGAIAAIDPEPGDEIITTSIRSGDPVEFPVAVTPRLRLPVYHTFAYFVSAQRFRRNLDALLRSGLPVFYEFHAADLLELVADGVDRRMDRHPGMGDSLARKRALLRETLQTITAARCVTTYRAAVDGGTWH
jgi:cystathionine beta-lyase/cystathionine gamma-synthase